MILSRGLSFSFLGVTKWGYNAVRKQSWTHQRDGEKAEKDKDGPKQVIWNRVAILDEDSTEISSTDTGLHKHTIPRNTLLMAERGFREWPPKYLAIVHWGYKTLRVAWISLISTDLSSS